MSLMRTLASWTQTLHSDPMVTQFVAPQRREVQKSLLLLLLVVVVCVCLCVCVRLHVCCTAFKLFSILSTPRTFAQRQDTWKRCHFTHF